MKSISWRADVPSAESRGNEIAAHGTCALQEACFNSELDERLAQYHKNPSEGSAWATVRERIGRRTAMMKKEDRPL